MNPNNECYTDFKNGKVAMFEGGYWASLAYKFQDKVTSGEFCFVPVPRASTADKYYYLYEGFGTAVASGAKNPDGIKAWLSCQTYFDYLYSHDKTYSAKYIAQTKATYGFTDLDMQMLNFITYNTTPVLLKYQGIGGTDGWLTKSWAMSTDVIDHQEPWSTVRDQYSPLLDAEIKKIQ